MYKKVKLLGAIILLIAILPSLAAGQDSQVTPCDKPLNFNHKSCKLKVKFKDLSYKECDEIKGWKWEFGDGSRAVGKKAVHKFSFVGTYSVRLYYYDATGKLIGSTSQDIHVDK